MIGERENKRDSLYGDSFVRIDVRIHKNVPYRVYRLTIEISNLLVKIWKFGVQSVFLFVFLLRTVKDVRNQLPYRCK